MALARALGIDSNPRTGGVEKGVAYVIFPDSGSGKPRWLYEINAAAQARFQKWGGLQMVWRSLNE